ncbi:MAG: InlB B-repeat-containing protein [Spirochaetales bacterium]|nr:InlB B-repeat-containing protein [Spirochaetales bacterium]
MKEKQLVLVGTIVLMLAMALTGCDTECGSSRSSSNNGETVTTVKPASNVAAIKFNANGGTGTMADLTADKGNSVALPANTFVRIGYTFTHWNDASGDSGTHYADKADIPELTADVTLFAQWTANSYTIVFNANGGTGDMEDLSMTYDVTKDLSPNKFTREWYGFTGWNTKADGSGTSYANGAGISNLTAADNDAVTLYAQWAAGLVNYTVKRYFQTVDGADYAQDTVKYPDLTKSGFTNTETAETADPITGFTAQPITQQTIAGDGSTVVNVYYDRKVVVYTFSANGGKWSDSTTEDKTVSVLFGANVGEPPVPEKTGYHYIWGLPEFDDNGGTKYTAQWTANRYTITYHSNYEDVTTQTITMTYDGTGDFMAGFSREGWSFDRWNTASGGTGINYAADTAVPNLTAKDGANIDLYALWYTVALAQVSIGDICYQNGASVIYSSNYLSDRTPIGIVYAKDTAVKIVHLSQSPTTLAWCLQSADGRNKNPATSTSDGSGNWQIICNAVSDEDVAGNYPAFEYVNGLGSGWYLPAKDELNAVYLNKTAINATLGVLSSAGVSVTTLGTGWYLSSSCVDYYYAWTQHFTDGALGNYMKYNECYVRAVQAF